VSPIIINVACFLLQHSVIFGQLASWQTVTKLFWFTTCLVWKKTFESTILDLIHSGFLLIGLKGLFFFF
jgi:hypothetical protein